MKRQIPLLAALAVVLAAGPALAGDPNSNTNASASSEDGKPKPKPAPSVSGGPRGPEAWWNGAPYNNSANAGSRSSSSSSSSSSSNAQSTKSDRSSNDEQQEIRTAVREGKILPLTDILVAVARRTPGTVIAVQLETEDGRKVYKVDVLTQSGRRMRSEVDAATAYVRKVENR